MPTDPRPSVDLNADLGEEVTDDAGLLEVVTSANVACGFHAGTPATMRAVCAEAARRGVVVGAQVSYRDRAGFGRVARDVPFEVLRDEVAEQVEILDAIAREQGTSVRYVKPHGALYHRVTDDPEQAAAVLAGSGSLPVLGFPGARLLTLAAAAGRAAYVEGFPDRGYRDGRLVDRASRVPCSRTAMPSRGRRCTWPGRSRRSASTGTRPERSPTRTPYAGRSRPPGTCSPPSSGPDFSTARRLSCGGSGRFCGGPEPACGGHAEPRK